MPVGIGIGRAEPLRPGVERPSRFAAPAGFHPGAVRLAAAAPILAILVLALRFAG